MKHPSLLICGASARAAAVSALRADIRPICVDLFADEDLRSLCPAIAVPRDQYPHGLVEICARVPPEIPWMYTGGLENHPRVIEEISRQRPLWGNPPEVVRRVRNPVILADELIKAGISTPEVRLQPDGLPTDGSWLVKPLRGSGGTGIKPWTGKEPTAGRYFQLFVAGELRSIVYFGLGEQSLYMGPTRQLVGCDWLHAKPFAYCGSLSPIRPTLEQPKQTRRFEALRELLKEMRERPELPKLVRRMGDVLTQKFQLRGIYGVDCVLKDGVPWVIEVNPRYTASVEVLELVAHFSMLDFHHSSFRGPLHMIRNIWKATDYALDPNRPGCHGKAILFAQRDLAFPEEGPWLQVLQKPLPLWEAPDFADIPAGGSKIKAGWPIMTMFARGRSAEECLEHLQERAADLDQFLFGDKIMATSTGDSA